MTHSYPYIYPPAADSAPGSAADSVPDSVYDPGYDPGGEVPPTYYVVFCHQVVVWWLRILKPDFRHCFLLAAHPNGLVLLDPLSHRWLLQPLPPMAAKRLEALLKENRLTFVKVTRLRAAARPMPPSFISCVSVVKRLLGIRSFLPLTPYRLYVFLRRGQ